MNKSYLVRVGVYLLTALISVALILYLGYHLFYGMSQKFETTPASPARVVSAVEADLFLFRNETPLRASSGASCIPAVSDGTRVAVYDTVARLYDACPPDTVSRLTALDTRLAVLEKMRDSTLSVRDAVAIDSEIYSVMQRISDAGRTGQTAGVSGLRASLAAQLNRRAVVTGSASDIEGAIASLRAEKNSVTASLGACRQQITAPRSGYYYSSLDGYESVFTADAARTMTPAEFAELIEREPDSSDSAFAGKLAPDYLWYAACLLPISDADRFSVGEEYSITFPFNDEKTLVMKLERLECDGEAERVMLVFSCGTLAEGFRFTRAQSASIAYRDYEGIRLPLAAIRAVDGVPGVYILRGSVVHYRAVSILLEKEDTCIVELLPGEDPPEGLSWLRQNDIVVVRGRGMYEGRVLS